MLQNISCDDNIEWIRSQLLIKVHIVQISDDDSLAESGSALGRFRIYFYSDHTAGMVLQGLRHVPGAAPQLQDALVPANQPHHCNIGAVWICIDGTRDARGSEISDTHLSAPCRGGRK